MEKLLSNNVIEVKELTHYYGNIKAIDNLSFNVCKGDIYGVIGADGAGKTTLFRLLTTLLTPQTGSVNVLGKNINTHYKKIRQEIGYMPGKFSLYQDLTIEENLRFYATIFGTTIKENYNLIKDIYSHIEPFKERKAGNLSGGMKQKLALSCALIHKPKILFLDEPTTGIDPISRKELWDMLKSLAKDGITIFVSTPYMDEALNCNKIAFMQHGCFLKENSPSQIIKEFRGTLIGIKGEDNKKLLKDLRKYFNTNDVYSFGDMIHLQLTKQTAIQEDKTEIKAKMEKEGNINISVSEIEPTLEDCFMQL